MLEPLLSRDASLPGRRIGPDRLREYADAIRYVLPTGCPWRHLPHDFEVEWSAAHQQFMLPLPSASPRAGGTPWTRRGVWDKALVALPEQCRLADGRKAAATGAVVDSSSVKASPVPAERGFDGAKKIDGIKRHILTDTSGPLLAVEVTPANEQDRAVLPRLLDAAKAHCPGITKVWADKGYTGPATRDLAVKTGVDIEIVTGPKPPPGTGFLVQARQWVVERTHAWINRNRRMVRQWEATLETHTGFLILSQIAVQLNRLK